LALGGGGSRGFAHIGVIRVLNEAKIPIDMIAGTSMGALIGAQCAMGLTHEQMVQLNREEWVRKKPLRDYVVPKSAILGGNKVWRMLERMFKDLTFEDLPIPFFAVAADLISGEEVDMSEGALVPAIRSSLSLPGIGMPVLYDGKYLVDGGVINNLPADLLKRQGADIIIAVNVTPQKEDDLFNVSDKDNFIIRLFKKNEAIKKFLESPSIFKILLRSLRLSTSSHIKTIVQDIDFYIRPDIRGIGLLQFEEIDEAILRGEESAKVMAPQIKAAIIAKTAS
jgi:NTE family protein